MNQKERLDYLLNEFKTDSVRYREMEIPEHEKRMALRSFMNIRPPKPMSHRILCIQDEFLKEEAEEKGIVTLEDIPSIGEEYGSSHVFADKLSIWQGDITRIAADAIVNAANSQMLGCFVPCHQCIDNAIHSAAGIRLREECSQWMEKQRKLYGADYEEPTGSAAITGAYNLPCKAVIHTVGPIVRYRLNDKLCDDLKNCYFSCLKCLVENGYRSIAFCCISTGEFHFPNDKAAEIATETVTEFLRDYGNQVDRVIFNVFKDIDLKLYQNLLI